MSERVLQGLPASPGLGAGIVRRLGAEVVADVAVPLEARPAELVRAAAALADGGRELEALAERLRAGGRTDEADVVDTGALMALDPALTASLEREVLEQGLPAPAALVAACEEHAQAIAALPDELLAARAADVRSLGRRAAALAASASLAGDGGARAASARGDGDPGNVASVPAAGVGPTVASAPAEGAGPVVLVAEDLGPADVAELEGGVAGVALAAGGPSAHAAVVARGLGVPMAVGLGPEVLAAAGRIVVDGDAGTAILEPSPERVTAAAAAAAARCERAARDAEDRALPAVTRDGRRVRVLVNAATAAEVEAGLAAGAEGVGLLRTELAFLDAPGWPDEEAHARALAPALAPLAGRVATVRVLDFGGDKTPPFLRGSTARGLALLLEEPAALEAQLRAILRAGAATRLRILLPMVESAAEVHAVRAMVESAVEACAARAMLASAEEVCPEGEAGAGVRGADASRRSAPEVRLGAGGCGADASRGFLPPVALGAMVETVAAAEAADELAAAADFLSIGTNDLTAAALGADRFRPGAAVAHDPRVLALIDRTARAARAARVPLEVCGEAASEPVVAPLLVGLGVDELSVGAARVGAVRAWVRALDAGTARSIAARALRAAGPAEVALLVQGAQAAGERLDRDRRVVAVGPKG